MNELKQKLRELFDGVLIIIWLSLAGLITMIALAVYLAFVLIKHFTGA